jgi:beta-galactosidase
MRKILNGKELLLGVCYYPEHWPKELWREDLKRMLDAGIEVVRVAEFAWNTVEVEEGVFDYSFWDEFLDLAEEMGMNVIMGTPTATPPAWLTRKYPEVLNCDINGNIYHHGMRRHYNYNSPVYQKLCSKIVEAFASHYAKRKCVIGWQIDNEINCETDVFYSGSDSNSFREYLKNKYQSLDELNKAWGTIFWNQTFTDWDEITVPRHTIQNTVNPHWQLDYIRFISDSANRWAKIQADIIRKYAKDDDFVTTNGIFGHLDYQKMVKESIDFITYDSYPNFAYCPSSYDENDPVKDRKWSMYLTETRSISKVFGIMEQQSGANGWTSRMEAPTPRPGQLTLWTMQSIAHGADFVSYFRWRTATMGTEIYWHGILDYSGRENRRLNEVKEVHKKIKALDQIAGSFYEAKVGILKDYDNNWDSEYDVWHGRVEQQSKTALFSALQKTHTPFDYIYLDGLTDASRLFEYDVLFYPHPTITDEKTIELLSEYVKAGGKLVMGCRSGYKDKTGKCVMDKLPGLFASLTGTDIPEYSLIAPDAGKVFVKWDEDEFEASVFTDLLCPINGGRQLAQYTSDYYAGSGAIICNDYGKGRAYYYGSAFTEEAVRVFLKKLNVMGPYDKIINLPETMELAVRKKDNKRYLFVLNYSRQAETITINQSVKDMYSNQNISGAVTINGYGTLVVEL